MTAVNALPDGVGVSFVTLTIPIAGQMQNGTVAPITLHRDPPESGGKRRMRSTPKGRTVDPDALLEVQQLLGDAPRRADLLIEHLHRLQDHYGHLSARHLAALAREMKLAQTEVYEVATFYHHFDVVREGDAIPPRLTVRVCESLSCAMAGSHDLLDKLPAILGTDVLSLIHI